MKTSAIAKDRESTMHQNSEKILLYITSWYPNNFGDSVFINTEIKYLSKNFERIVVLSNGNVQCNMVENIPENVSYYFFPPVSKVKMYATSICCLFKKEFYKELFFLFKAGLNFHRLYSMVGFLTSTVHKRKFIKKILKNTQVSLCYTFWYWNDTLATLLYCKAMGPVVTRAHGFDLYKLRQSHGYQPFKHQMDSLLTKVYFISQQGMEYYIKNFGGDQREKYCLNYLGVENDIPYEFKCDNNILRLVSCSNVIPLKRLELIIDALSSVSDVDIHWTHIGGGSEYGRIQQYAQEKLGKTNVAYNFLGHQDNAEVMEFYKNHRVDLFVNVSESEGLPVSMMEAMSFGIPVCGTDVGGVREIVDDSCGFLLPSDYSSCTKELAAVVRQYSTFSLTEKKVLHDNAYKKWQDKFDAKNNYKQFADNVLALARTL